MHFINSFFFRCTKRARKSTFISLPNYAWHLDSKLTDNESLMSWGFPFARKYNWICILFKMNAQETWLTHSQKYLKTQAKPLKYFSFKMAQLLSNSSRSFLQYPHKRPHNTLSYSTTKFHIHFQAIKPSHRVEFELLVTVHWKLALKKHSWKTLRFACVNKKYTRLFDSKGIKILKNQH